jgi:hypothetical protein
MITVALAPMQGKESPPQSTTPLTGSPVLLLATILVITGLFAVLAGAPTPSIDLSGSQEISYCAAFPLNTSSSPSGQPASVEGGAGPSEHGAQAPLAFPLGLVNGTNWTAGPWSCYGYQVGYVASGLTIGRIGIEVKTFHCAPTMGVYAIDLLDRGVRIIASENLSASNWGTASEMTPTVGDRLIISATRPLTGDELVLRSGSGQEAFPIAGSGAWDGCEY